MRHLDIHEDDLVGKLARHLDGLHTVGGDVHRASELLQHLHGDHLIHGIVLGEQDATWCKRHVARRWRLSRRLGPRDETAFGEGVTRKNGVIGTPLARAPEHSFERREHRFRATRLREVDVEPRRPEALCVAALCGRCGEHESHVAQPRVGAHGARDVCAVQSGHEIVHDCRTKRVAGVRRGSELAHRIVSADRHLHAHAPRPEPLEHHAHVDVDVVDDQGACSRELGGRRSLRHGRRIDGQVDREPERRPRALSAAFRTDVAAHEFHNLLADGEAKTGAAESAGCRRVGLRECREERGNHVLVDADSRVLHLHTECEPAGCGLLAVDGNEHVAALSELDGVACQVEQNLAQAARVADHASRCERRVANDELDVLLDGAWRQQFGDFADGDGHVERNRFDGHLARLDLGEVENVVDHAHEQLRGMLCGVHELALFARQLCVGQQTGHPQYAVHGRANLMRHGREELALGLCRGLGLHCRILERLFCCLAACVVDRDDGEDLCAAHGELAPANVDAELRAIRARAVRIGEVALEERAHIALPHVVRAEQGADRPSDKLLGGTLEVARCGEIGACDDAGRIEQEQAVGRRVDDAGEQILAADGLELSSLALIAQALRAPHALPRGEVEEQNTDAQGVVDALQCGREDHGLVAILLNDDANIERLDPGPCAHHGHSSIVAIAADIDTSNS